MVYQATQNIVREPYGIKKGHLSKVLNTDFAVSENESNIPSLDGIWIHIILLFYCP